MEIYFWSLVVAILIFALGGGMSVYEGVSHITHPHHIEKPAWNYAVLGFAILFESASFFFAFRAFPHRKRESDSDGGDSPQQRSDDLYGPV